MIKCIPWKPYIPTHRTNLHDRAPTPLRIDLAKHPQRLLGHIHGPPKVRLHLLPSVASAVASKSPPRPYPALLMTTSMRPNFCSAAAMADATSVAEVTSSFNSRVWGESARNES